MPVAALHARAMAFVVRVPGEASEREVAVRRIAEDGRLQNLTRLQFRGPEAHTFASPAERDAEFNFQD